MPDPPNRYVFTVFKHLSISCCFPCVHLNLSYVFLRLYLPTDLALFVPKSSTTTFYSLRAIIWFPAFVLQGRGDRTRAWHMLGFTHPPSSGPSLGLNFELIWMSCVKQAPLLDLIVSLIIFCASFHLSPTLLSLSITPSPALSFPGDQVTLGLLSTPPPSECKSFFSSIHSTLSFYSRGLPFSLSFHFNTGLRTSRGQVHLIGDIIICY